MAVVLLVSLAVAASAGGFLLGADSERTTTYPDGFDESGVTDATAASQSHQAALDGAGSWRAVYDVDVRSNGTGVGFTETRTVDRSGGQWREHVRIESPDVDQETFAGGQRAYTRITADGEPRFSAQETATDSARASYAELLAVFLDGIAFERESVAEPGDRGPYETGDRVLITYAGDEVVADGGLPLGDEYQTTRAVRAEVVVDERGLIHEFAFEGALVTDTGTDEVAFSVTVTDVGATTVEEPAWVDRAVETTDTTDD